MPLPVCTALPWRLLAALAVGRGAGAGLGSHRRPCTGNFWSVLMSFALFPRVERTEPVASSFLPSSPAPRP